MEIPHTAFCIFYSTTLLGKSNQSAYFFTCHLVRLYLIRQSKHLVIFCRIQRINNRKRELSLCQVIPCRLADIRFRVIIVEDVIANLEHNSEILSETSCRIHFLFRGTGRHCPDRSTRFKKCGGLAFDYPVISFFRDIFTLDIRQLQNLSITQCLPQPRQSADNSLRMCVTNIQQGR